MELRRTDHNLLTTDRNGLRLVLLSSYGLAIITLITFVFAIRAVPISGANAPDGGILYPYLETIGQYPKDYIWQYLALVMICIYLINIILIKAIVTKEKQVYMQVAGSFAMIAAVTLLINYFVQVNVVPISLMNQEYDGIALLTQYNPHGIFIALEELGYIMMVVSFRFLIPVFRGKYTNVIAVVYLLAVLTALAGLVFISLQYGLNKMDRFEVIIISITWSVLIINGILIGNKVRALMND